MNAPSPAAKPDLATLLSRVEELKPMFRDAARDTERNRRVSLRSMDSLKKAEIHKVLQPAMFGGFEYGFTDAMRLAFEIGRVCGSTGWCASLTMAYPWLLSFFSRQAQAEVWVNPGAGLCTASTDPENRVEVLPGGIACSGIWRYASNCENSQWMMLPQVIPGPDGAPVRISALLPITEGVIDQDTWFTSGLQGTGSKSIHIKNPVFVPQHRLTRLDGTGSEAPGTTIEHNVMSRFSFASFSTSMLAAPLLGMAQGALDVFIKMSQTKVQMSKPGVTELVSNSPLVQSKVAMMSVMIDSAFSLLLTSTEAAEKKRRAGLPLDLGERITLRRNQGFAGRQAVAVVNELFAFEGASASNLAGALQRFWRDVNTGAQHFTLNWEAISTMYGQYVYGLEPVGSMY